MKELYSIGKMSAMMGISAQVLRHYCDIGLITPEYINPETGYRYFSFAQFHYIDRTRYLLKCGFHLSEIKAILEHNDMDYTIDRLHRKQEEVREQIRRAQDSLKTLEWYEEYFTSGEHANQSGYFRRHCPTRWLLAIHCDADYRFKDFYPAFSALREQPELQNIRYRRQFVSILDATELMEGHRKRYYAGMFTLEKPDIESPAIIEIPEGDYWCFRAPILGDHWKPLLLRELVHQHGTPRLLLTMEYENSMISFKECPHEVQILF